MAKNYELNAGSDVVSYEGEQLKRIADALEIEGARMTGQEWYDRFEKELEELEAGGWVDESTKNVLGAAKKASGLEE